MRRRLTISAKLSMAIAASISLPLGILGQPLAGAQPQQPAQVVSSAPISSEEPEPAPSAGTMEDLFDMTYQNAVVLYRQNKYTDAVTEFKKAYDIKPTPRLLFNIAQCYRKNDQLLEGIEYFTKYLASDADASTEVRAEVQAYKSELEAKLQARAASERRKIVVIATEKPAPRWYLPFGASALALGIGGLAAGASLVGIDGKCADTPQLPALECDRLYNSSTDGAVISAVGGSMVVIGSVFIVISLRRPRTTQKTEITPSLLLNINNK